jgi:hypothetical protein
MKLKMTRRRAWAIGAAAILMLVWLLWPDRTLARVRALRNDLSGEAGKALPPEEREAKSRQLREQMQKLTSEQRDELFADARQHANDEMEQYVKLSPAEKRKHLDQQINRMEEMRKRMQQRPPQAPGGGPQQGNGSRGFGGGPRGESRPQTPDDRERRRQQRLDRSSPRERQLRDMYRRDLENRRRERGLPPTPSFPRGGR